MFTDLALTDVKDDRLGRKLLAKEIATGLIQSFSNNSDSIVIGINGAWGSGKSTLVNFIIDEVEIQSSMSYQRIVVLRFNPWMFSGQKELQSVFLKELFLKFRSKSAKLKKASKKLGEYLGHLEGVKYVHSGLGEAIKDSKSFFKELGSDKDLNDLKKAVDDILIKEQVKLYITIDDIDRLLPSEITDIFQLVKLNGNFANTVFMLAYDHEVVASALDSAFHGRGSKYLEKIIQVDYTLPRVSSGDIARIFMDSINETFSKSILEQITSFIPNFKSEVFVGYFSSIRDIYRFINALQLRLPSIYQELNIRDFFIVESIRIFQPHAYFFIMENKSRLTQQDDVDRVKASKSGKNETLSEFIGKEGFDKTTTQLLTNLFVFEGGFSGVDPRELIRDRRVANKNYFDRYFNLQLSDLDIEEKYFDLFIGSPDVLVKIGVLEMAHKQEKLHQFIRWSEVKMQGVKLNANLILSAVFDFLDRIKYVREHFVIDSDFMVTHRFANYIVDRISKIELRRSVILQYVSRIQMSPVFSSVFLTSMILVAIKKHATGRLRPTQSWYSLVVDDDSEYVDDEAGKESVADQKKGTLDSFSKEVESIYLIGLRVLFEFAVKSPYSLGVDEMTFVLRETKRLHSSLYDGEFPNLIKDDKLLLQLVLSAINSRYASSGGSVSFSLSRDQFFDNMDVEEIKRRFERLNIEELDNEQRHTVNFFNRAYRDEFKSDLYYSFYDADDLGVPLGLT